MLSPEEIDEQQQLLATYRRTLSVYLQQQAEIGRAYSPPGLVNGIADTRASIKRIKSLLTNAGITIAEDPDDDEESPPPVRPRLPAAAGGPRPTWVLPAIVAGLAVVLAVGVGWWLARPLGTSPESDEAPSAVAAADLPTAEEDISLGLAETPQVATETPTPVDSTLGESETQAAGGDTSELEQRLGAVNIELSGSQADAVRGFIADSSTGYKLLAEHALEIVGGQKFRQPIYLDELDVKYTEIVGEDNYANFETDKLKQAMVAAWNNHYPDESMDSFDQIVE